jgi:hypothetical protein
MKRAIEEVLRMQHPGSNVWVKGHYDQLYEQIKGGKKTVCYVDYNPWGTDQVYRDICTIKPETMEFTSRGHGYGTSKYSSGNEKELFIQLCESIHVEWICESPNEQPIEQISQDAHEKEVMMRAFDKVRQIFEMRSWIMEGRGSYPYNDDRYREEVRYMYNEFDELHKNTWANIKSHSSEYRQAIIAEYLKREQKENEAVAVDELWDEHSEMIDDDIDSLSRWAGSVVMRKAEFIKAINEYKKQKEVKP